MGAKGIMEDLGKSLKFKNDKIELPETYLGAKLSIKVMDGIKRWTISSGKYVEVAVKTVEQVIKDKKRYKCERNQKTPMVGSYAPELDGSPELNEDDLTLFQELIGVLRWATEIGRVGILHEVGILS